MRFAKETMGQMRFYFQPVMLVFAMVCLVKGGLWMWVCPVLIFFSLSFIDEIFEESDDSDETRASDVPLFLAIALFLVVWILYLAVVGYSFQSWGGFVPIDLSGLGGLLEPQPLWALVGATWTFGMLGIAICNIAHEFAHRLSSPVRRFIGQWLLCFALHSSMPIEHVFGHHKNAALYDDPVSARRGEGFWLYMLRSFIGTYRNAFNLEKQRAARNGTALVSVHNKVFVGYLMQASLVAISFLFGGLAGVTGFLGAAILSLVILEQFQYISHYGLTRIPGTPMRVHHSWDFSRLGSNSFMFNQTRHSDHHLSARKQYADLAKTDETVSYPFSPILMLIIVLYPPLFRKVVSAELQRWDNTLASTEEREFIQNYLHADSGRLSDARPSVALD